MNQPQIEVLKTADLIPYARNSRTHSDAQISQIAASIKEFGFTNPVLIDNDNGIIAGHGRVLGASLLKLETVPCIRLGYLTDTQKRAYIIADNKIALNAGWDAEMLALEFADLKLEGFDFDLLGFDDDELLEFMPVEKPEETEKPAAAFNYQENYSVLVICKHEAHQTEIYDRLIADGLECKVLVN
jgi:ParB-like chromosome segregation protein Spo0J